jgi:DNA gyrase subunit B
MNKTANKYSESNIQVYSGLGGIRKRPTMYIGPTDSHGIFMLVKELADNTRDEFNANRNKSCTIVIDPPSIYVIDEADGIPVGKITDKQTGRTASALEFIVSEHHAGGKFESSAYNESIGVNGLGITIVNALSAKFAVWTCRNNQWYWTEYQKTKCTANVQKVTPKALPDLAKFGIKPTRGTIVQTIPDKSIFDDGAKLPVNLIREWCEITAYLNAGFQLNLITPKGKTTWHYPNGLVDFLNKTLVDMEVEVAGKLFTHHAPNIDIALAFTSYESDLVQAFTNSSRTPDGGAHVESMWRMLAKTLKPYANKKEEFNPTDLRDGVVGFINYKLDNPKFSSQTKEKLVDARVKDACDAVLEDAFTTFWNENKSLAKSLCTRASHIRAAKEALTKNKKVILALKGNKYSRKSLLPGKLSAATRCTPEQREVFLCEGLSAAGCFTGETPILLANGDVILLEDLVAQSS